MYKKLALAGLVAIAGVVSVDADGYRNSDGSYGNRVGNSTYNSDGSSSNKVGNSIYNSDGSSSNKVGNTYYHSDGTSTTVD